MAMSEDERREKWRVEWGPARNARRRKAYREDDEYARQVREARRESYRKSSGTNPGEYGTINPRSCLANLSKVDTCGTLRAVSLDGREYVLARVFTQGELSGLLNRLPEAVSRWRTKGWFPPPVLRDAEGRTYFADEEVRRIVRIMGQHQERTLHYRKNHADTRRALHAAAFVNDAASARSWVDERRPQRPAPAHADEGRARRETGRRFSARGQTPCSDKRRRTQAAERERSSVPPEVPRNKSAAPSPASVGASQRPVTQRSRNRQSQPFTGSS